MLQRESAKTKASSHFRKKPKNFKSNENKVYQDQKISNKKMKTIKIVTSVISQVIKPICAGILKILVNRKIDLFGLSGLCMVKQYCAKLLL